MSVYPEAQAELKVEVVLTNAAHADDIKVALYECVKGSGNIDWTSTKGSKLTGEVRTWAPDTLFAHLTNDNRVESFKLT